MCENRDFRQDFPVLARRMNGKPLAYLDNGATTQKPAAVIKAAADYYNMFNANPHRGAYELSIQATDVYEAARAKVKRFINAAHSEEIIFTRNATESLNLVAYSYGLHKLRPGDRIVLTIAEHHSNLVPWQQVAAYTGAVLDYIYLDEKGNLSREDMESKINSNTRIVAVTQVSNVLGLINDVRYLAKKAHEAGAVIIVDGSQSVAHIKVDVQDIGADFFVFSGHKIFAPMGIGVLYGRKKLLEKMPPFLTGGDMVDYVTKEKTDFAPLPAKFEAGTQNVGGAAGLAAALDYLGKVGFARIAQIEQELLDYALSQLLEMPYIKLYGCASPQNNKIGIITFNVQDVHPHDVATILDASGIAIRAGHHCAQPLLHYLGVEAACRASFAFYNNREDIDYWVEALGNVRKVLGYGS